MRRKKRINKQIEWVKADDISARITELVAGLEFSHIDPKRIFCLRSNFSSARAYARIWSLPTVWQLCFEIQAHYVIEVLSEKFDPLPHDEQTKVLIHELMHIPRTFSGALVPHHGRFHKINNRTVEQLFNNFMQSLKTS